MTAEQTISLGGLLYKLLEQLDQQKTNIEIASELSGLRIRDIGRVVAIRGEDDFWDDILVTIEVQCKEYLRIDGRKGLTKVVFLHGDSDETSWFGVQVGDTVEYETQVNCDFTMGDIVEWHEDGKNAEIGFATMNSRCLSVVKEADYPKPGLPLTPYPYARPPEYINVKVPMIEVHNRIDMNDRLADFWKITLNSARELRSHSDLIIEVNVFAERGSAYSYLLLNNGRQKLVSLCNLNCYPIREQCYQEVIQPDVEPEVCRSRVSLEEFHLRFVRQLADSLRASAVSAILAGVTQTRRLQILASRTDTVETREFVEIWPELQIHNAGEH